MKDANAVGIKQKPNFVDAMKVVILDDVHASACRLTSRNKANDDTHSYLPDRLEAPKSTAK